MVSSQGAAHYSAPNPEYGATITYYLSEGLTTKKAEREQAEKEAKELSFPTWDQLEAERREDAPKIWLTIKDDDGKVVRRMTGPSRKGLHRVAWDFRYNGKSAIRPGQSSRGWRGRGFLALPGTYSVTIAKEENGQLTQLAGPQTFEVERLHKGALTPQAASKIVAFREELETFMQELSAVSYDMDQQMEMVEAMQTAAVRMDEEDPAMMKQLYELKQSLYDIEEMMNGNRSKSMIGERTRPTVQSRMSVAFRGMNSTYGPTQNHRNSLAIAKDELVSIKTKLESTGTEIKKMSKKLAESGAPWIEGQTMPKN